MDKKELFKCFLKWLDERLICPNCHRKVPNKEHFVTGGCKWCQKS